MFNVWYNEYAEEFAMRKKCAEEIRNDITPYMRYKNCIKLCKLV